MSWETVEEIDREQAAARCPAESTPVVRYVDVYFRDWTPTERNIKALPAPVREYIETLRSRLGLGSDRCSHIDL